MSQKIKVGSIVKLKKGLSAFSLSDYNLKKYYNSSNTFFEVTEILNYFGNKDDLIIRRQNDCHAVIMDLVELASEKEVARASWFANRPLDIDKHPKTHIFK